MESSNKPPLLPPPLSAWIRRAFSSLVPAVVGGIGVTAFPTFWLLAVALFWQANDVVVRAATVWQYSAADSSVTRPIRPVTSGVREAQIQRFSPLAGAMKSEPGLSYTNVKVPSEPWSLHVLKIDRSQKDLTFYSSHAGKKVLGVGHLRDQAAAVPPEFGRAIAAVNGDFYDRDNPTYAGDPRGLQIIHGELISAPDTVCVWFDADGNPHLDEVKGDFSLKWPNGGKTPFGLNQRRRSRMTVLYTPTYGPSTRAAGGRELILEKDGDGPWLPLQAGQSYRARVREVSTTGNTQLAPDAMVLSFAPELLAGLPEVVPGAVLQISTATTPDLKGVKMAIAGGPAIIKDGKPFALKNPPPGVAPNYAETSKYQRHPRSAVGWSPTHVYFVTVDGRQPGLSVGMKLAELAEFMAGLGCTEAMNLDGGKSAQLWMNGRLLNSAQVGEDTVANALLVVRKPEGR